jgi:phosphoserine phosphatase
MPDTSTFVATLISAPEAAGVTDDVLAEARRVLRTPHQPRPLHGEVAAEILFEAGDDEASRAEDDLRAALGAVPLDIVVQPALHRRKRLLLADMDSTMIGQECIDELADYAGLKAEVAGITERAMRGDIAFEPALRERVALLKDLPVGIVDEILRSRIHLTPGGRALVATMKAHGAYTCLVSGGFSVFTGPLAQKLGFDEQRANRLVVAGEKLAGTVEEPILGRDAKRATLIELRDKLGLEPAATLAVGDGANDLPMLQEAGLGVAFRAKPAVAAAAGARIAHGDLTALLYMQGFSAAEFVEG